ncbi:MAG: thioredoxin family protein, partial [Bacteroidales bacterium]
MRIYVLVTLFIVFSFCTFAQNSTIQQDTKIHWMDFETAIEKQKQDSKIIMVDMYTDWCGWCKKLEKETFSHPEIAAYINRNFHPVKFNAETTDTITYYGETFINKGSGNRATHQLAYVISNSKKISYPSTVFIDEN